jgi:hypothetical protein
MARLNDNDVKYSSMPLTGWGLSFDLTGKGHPIAKRVWKTKADMIAYLKDELDSAVPGIILVVTNDPIEDNNGAYLVKCAAGVDGHDTTSVTEANAVIKLANGDIQNLTIAEGSAGGVKIEDNKLTIPDMRTYWDDQSFN